MAWFTSLVIIALLSLVSVLYLQRRRAVKTSDRASKTSSTASQGSAYWGIEIVAPSSASSCLAAQQLRGKGFSKSEAPLLPLSDCTMRTECQCQYEYMKEKRSHQDRRSGIERRSAIRIKKSSERRIGNERRSDSSTWRDIDSH